MRAALLGLLVGWHGIAVLVRAEVNLPPGFEIVEFAESEFGIVGVDLNECGQIAFGQWQGPNGHSEIFIYDNGDIIQMTHGDDRNVNPNINNSGQIVWGRGIDRDVVTQVIFWDGEGEVMVDENPNGINGRALNNLGSVYWARSISVRCPREENLFMWDGEGTTQLTFDSELSNIQPSPNDHGEYAWMHAQFCENPWVADVVIHGQDGDLTPPSPGTQNQSPDLTNSGLAIWKSSPRLMFWNGSESRQLLERGGNGALNDWPRVSVPIYDTSTSSWHPWLLDVGEFDVTSYQLADNTYWYSSGAINEWGEIATEWAEDPPNSKNRGGVMFLRRIRTGDSEFDGDIDLRDHKRFCRAMTGPVRTNGLCEDRFLDINHDGDLDLHDYAAFQNDFSRAIP